MVIDNVADREKFEKIYIKYRELMYRVAFEVLGNKQEAEDAVQQAFVFVAENINQIDMEGLLPVGQYLAALSKEKAVELSRKKGVL